MFVLGAELELIVGLRNSARNVNLKGGGLSVLLKAELRNDFGKAPRSF